MAAKHILVALLGALFIVGCTGADNGNNSDNDASTDTDTDTDTDSDTDSDSDADGDTDTGPEDAGVIPMDCSQCNAVGDQVADMVCAIDLCDASVVDDAQYTSPSALLDCTLEDTYEAVDRFGDAANGLSPKLNDSYALMGTGPVVSTSHNLDCDQSLGNLEDDFSSETYTIHDVMNWRLDLTAPQSAQGFRFKYVFFSEEYDEFIGQIYNDKFYVVLESENLNDGDPTVINFTQCRQPAVYWDFICSAGDEGCVQGEKYCYVAINTALSDCCWYESCPGGYAWNVGTNIDGTGFGCSGTEDDGPAWGSSTGWLQTNWPIEGGESFSITFHVHDTSDGILDSAVIIDAFEFLRKPQDPVTVPVE